MSNNKIEPHKYTFKETIKEVFGFPYIDPRLPKPPFWDQINTCCRPTVMLIRLVLVAILIYFFH